MKDDAGTLNQDDDFRKQQARWVRIMNSSNGYGDAFNYQDKTDKAIVEASVAQEWCDAMRESFDLEVSRLEQNWSDPPDFYCEIEGQRLGLELVQLIDRKQKARSKRGESPYSGKLFRETQWSLDRFRKELSKIVTGKGEKYKDRSIFVEILVIFSGEPWLSTDEARTWVDAVKELSHPNIGNAFLLLEYEPGRGTETWPLFKLYGELTGSP